MAKRTTTKGSTYLYAVTAGAEEKDFGPMGLYDSDVHTINDGEVTAVVSEIPIDGKLRPERRHLAAHQSVLSHLVEEADVVLPVSFGTVADSAEAIRNLLARYKPDLLKQIKRVQGKVEMELRVVYDVQNVFEYVITQHPELREMRDSVFDSKHEPSRDEKIELGQLFERLLNEDRERYTKKVTKALSSRCSEIKENKCRNEQEIMRLSCLISKDEKEAFETALAEVADTFDDNFAFEHAGPYPPYNFIEIRIKV
jgi:hypothetical protein